MKKSTGRVFLMSVPCECGGTLQPSSVSEYTATAELGVPVVIVGQIPGLACDKCNAFAVSLAVIEVVSSAAVEEILRLPRRLSGTEAKFLRKAGLGVDQQTLATRLGVSRSTIARWEAETSLSANHDFDLRSLVVGHVLRRARVGAKPTRRTELVDLAQTVLSGARQKRAPKRLPRLRIAA